jgi:hypothetical protein
LGSKGSQQTTQQYTANPATQSLAANFDANAQNLPGPGGVPQQGVAGLTPYQSQAIGLQAGTATNNPSNPYFQTGGQYIANSAQPLSQTAQPIYNSMVAGVMPQLQNIFGAQQSQNTGSLTNTAGGVGASRIAVGQGDLANQQTLAAGQVLSGLQGQAYGTAAQQSQLQQGAGALSYAAGPAALQAQLTGYGAENAAGTQQQQQQQNLLNSQFAQQTGQYQNPFQVAQTQQGVLSATGQALQGTTTNTYPPPSQLGQDVGLAEAGLGILGAPFTGGASLGMTMSGLGSAFNSATTQAASGMSTGDLSALTGEDAATSEAALAAMPFGFKRGGAAGPYASGGAVNPYDPMNGELPDARASVRPAVGSYDDGGDVSAPNPIDQANLMENAVLQGYRSGGAAGYADGGPVGDTSINIDSGIGATSSSSVAPSWASNLPIQTGSGAFPSALPPNVNVPTTNTGNPGTQPYMPLPPSAGFPSSAPPANPWTAGGAMPPSQGFPTPPPPAAPPVSQDTGQGAAPPSSINPMSAYGSAIAAGESGGDYGAVGTAVGDDHAYGKYQVMGSNIPSWTKEVLGKSMTPQQFLADPKAQDAVFNAKFGQYVQHYGPEGAARAWFAGEGNMNNPNAKDANGMTVAQYSGNFMRRLGSGSENASLPPSSSPTGFQNPYAAPSGGRGFPTIGDTTPSPDEATSGRLASSPWMALVRAGLGTMAASGQRDARGLPMSGVGAIGKGGLEGVEMLEQQEAESNKYNRMTADQKAALGMQAQQLAFERQREADQYSKMTPAQAAAADAEKQKLQLEQMKPIQVGFDPFKGPIMAMRDPATGKYVLADQMTTANPPTGVPTAVLGANPAIPAPSISTSSAPAASPANTPPQSVTPATPPPTESPAAVPPGYKPTALNNDVLQAHPDLASQIIAVDEGRTKLTSFPAFSRAGVSPRSAMEKLVTQYDPDFEEGKASQRIKLQDDLSTNGNAGKMLLATNQILPHMGIMSDKIAALNNQNILAGNRIKNWAATEVQGDPAVKDFNTVREVVSTDAARLLRGTGQMAEKDIEFWRENLSSANSPQQLNQQLATLGRDLIGARVDSIKNSYRGIMNREPPPWFVSPDAQAAISKLSSRDPRATSNAAPPQLNEERTNAHGVVGRWNGTGWDVVH